MEEIKLKAQVRGEKSTKKELSELRQKRQIPGVVYGGNGTALNVTVGEKELLGAMKTGGANAVIHLEHPKGKDTVMVKALQRHVVTSEPVHVDFQRIDLKKKVDVKVPLHLTGEAPGVKLQGGVLDHTLRELAIRALPNKIPQSIDVDVSALNVGNSILVKDLRIPEGVEVLESPDRLVAHVVHVTVEEAPAAAAPAEGAPAEPEVIAKGKKEEEGEGAKPGAKAEGGAKAEEGKKEAKK